MFILRLLFLVVFLHGSVHAIEKFFVLTLPKSGTHYIMNILEIMTPLKPRHCDVQFRQGCFFTTHFHTAYGQKIFEHMKNDLDTKIICIYRNPRDVVISWCQWADKEMRKGTHHKQLSPKRRKEWDRMTLEQRIVKMLKEKWMTFEALEKDAEMLIKFIEKYRQDKRVLFLTFEELINKRERSRVGVVRKIAGHLKIPFRPLNAYQIMEDAWGHSNTFNKPGTDKWKQVFTPQIMSLYQKTPLFRLEKKLKYFR